MSFFLNKISSIPVMGWKENNLMRAELAFRGQAGQGDALALVNEVRAVYSIAPLTEITLNTVGKPSIVEERDKQLNCQGMRLPDQRRFNLWHLPGKWQFLPVIEDERIGNPNF